MPPRMTATKIKENETGWETRPSPKLPWHVILHNDWENSMPWVVVIFKKVIPGITLKKATPIMYEAHRTGRALGKRYHKELAELYKDPLRGEGLTLSIESSN